MGKRSTSWKRSIRRMNKSCLVVTPSHTSIDLHPSIVRHNVRDQTISILERYSNNWVMMSTNWVHNIGITCNFFQGSNAHITCWSIAATHSVDPKGWRRETTWMIYWFIGPCNRWFVKCHCSAWSHQKCEVMDREIFHAPYEGEWQQVMGWVTCPNHTPPWKMIHYQSFVLWSVKIEVIACWGSCTASVFEQFFFFLRCNRVHSPELYHNGSCFALSSDRVNK